MALIRAVGPPWGEGLFDTCLGIPTEDGAPRGIIEADGYAPIGGGIERYAQGTYCREGTPRRLLQVAVDSLAVDGVAPLASGPNLTDQVSPQGVGGQRAERRQRRLGRNDVQGTELTFGSQQDDVLVAGCRKRAERTGADGISQENMDSATVSGGGIPLERGRVFGTGAEQQEGE
jgi:hypothetical protein